MPSRYLALLLLSLGIAFSMPRCLLAKSPHIVCIMADDLGWMDLHCQGNNKLHTPNLDRLATQGARFSQAYAAAPVCSPTRAALITGLAPARLQITQHGADGPQFWPDDRLVQPPVASHELSTEALTMAERLKSIGYATGFFGKWHLGGSQAFWPLRHGFDVNVGGCGFGGPPTYFDPYRIPTLTNRQPGEYLTDRLADEAIAFLRREHEQPMFVCLWTYNPHYPFEAPAELIDKYRDQLGVGLKNATYGAQIEATDRAVGRVLDTIAQLHLENDTLVIFTSDNGGWTGATDNRPLKAGKGYLYEGGLRVPLIIRWPGVSNPGTTIPEPVISMDLTATILDAAAVEHVPGRQGSMDQLDGQSLRALLTGETWQREAIYFHYPHYAFHKANRPGSAVRLGNYKLILNHDDDSIELYDLQADAAESHNLAEQEPEIAEKLRSKLVHWLAETNAGLPTKRHSTKVVTDQP